MYRDEEKVREYLWVIEERIVRPLQKSDLLDYCTATLLLVFAGMDGLARLVQESEKAGVRARITGFLPYMGERYGECKKELYELRCSLVHEAINVASYLSQTEWGEENHLRKGAADFIYVNSRVMAEDFIKAFEQVSQEILSDEKKLARAAYRLEFRDVELPDSNYREFPTTEPPPIKFIQTKTKGQ